VHFPYLVASDVRRQHLFGLIALIKAAASAELFAEVSDAPRTIPPVTFDKIEARPLSFLRHF
jgi:hypothetical protein